MYDKFIKNLSKMINKTISNFSSNIYHSKLVLTLISIVLQIFLSTIHPDKIDKKAREKFEWYKQDINLIAYKLQHLGFAEYLRVELIYMICHRYDYFEVAIEIDSICILFPTSANQKLNPFIKSNNNFLGQVIL